MVVIGCGEPNDRAADLFTSIENDHLVSLVDQWIGLIGKGVGGADGFRFKSEHAEVLLLVNGFFDEGEVVGRVAHEFGVGCVAALVDGAGDVEVALVIEMKEGSLEIGSVESLVLGDRFRRRFGFRAG